MYLWRMELPPDKLILLFDGVCNLCNHAVQFVIRHDRHDRFRLAALQSQIGQELIRERHINPSRVDSIILIDPGVAYYIESEAAWRIAWEFGGGWKLLGVFRWLPVRLRDALYRWIAGNRYKWFGKREACMLPTPEIRKKFL